MSVHGFGRMHIVEGTMRSDQYINVLRTRMQLQAADWYDGPYIFQQDNAPCHTSKVVKNYMMTDGINLLPWPSNSPDMNPIETLWAVLKGKLRDRSCTSRQTLINHILDITTRNGPLRDKFAVTCRKLVEGMPTRVEALYHAKGGHTKY